MVFRGDGPLDGLLLVLLVVLLFMATTVVLLGSALRITRDREDDARGRSWWENPMVWIGIALVSLLLGLLVAPQFLGGAVVFLPFIWIGRTGRRGHAQH